MIGEFVDYSDSFPNQFCLQALKENKNFVTKVSVAYSTVAYLIEGLKCFCFIFQKKGAWYFGEEKTPW